MVATPSFALAAALLALTAIFGMVDPAEAAEITVAGSDLTLTAGNGISNGLTVTVSGSQITMHDTSEAVDVTASALLFGCTQDNANTATCNGLASAQFLMGDGDDTVTVAGTGAGVPMTVDGDADNDLLIIGDGVVDLAALTTTVTYNGGANAPTPTTQLVLGCSVPDGNPLPVGNTFQVVNTAGAAATYGLGATGYAGPGGTVTLSSVQSVSLLGGSGGDTFDVTSTPASTNVAIEGRAGTDQIAVLGTGASTNLVVDGGPEADTITIGTIATGTRLLALGDGGQDRLTVRETAAGSVARVSGGDGTDSVSLLASPTVRLDKLLGNLCIDGDGDDGGFGNGMGLTCAGGGSASVLGFVGDEITFFDFDLTGTVSYGLAATSPTTTTFQRSGIPPVQLGTFEIINIFTDWDVPIAPPLTLQIDGTPTNSFVEVGGIGNVTVTNTGDGSLLRVGSADRDDVMVVQQLGEAAIAEINTRTGDDSVSVGMLGAGRLLNIMTSAGADTIAAQGIGAGGWLRIAGGDGNDAIALGNAAGSLDQFAGRTCVEGEGHDDSPPAPQSVVCAPVVLGMSTPVGDTLTLADQGDPDPNAYLWTSIGSTGVARLRRNTQSPSASINGATIETVVLNAGAGVSTFNVDGLASPATTVLNGGAGNDQLTVATTTGGESLLFNGGPGQDTATIQATKSGTLVFVAGGDDADTISLQSLGSSAGARLNGDGGADTIGIQALPAGSAVVFDGGADTDAVTVGPPASVAGAVCGAQPGTLQLSAPTYTVGEAAGSAAITVRRTGGSTGAVSATVSTAAGSATTPDDFTATTVSVSFPDEDSADKTVLIPIVNDGLIEADELLSVSLSAPTGGATLGGPVAATITIVSDDAPVRCSPRPNVRLQPTATGDALQVAVTATPLDSQTNNAVTEIRFESWTNATVTAGGQTHTGPFTLTLPPQTFATTFVVHRAATGQPTHVPFVVVDGCGEWRTFVGGGATAGF